MMLLAENNDCVRHALIALSETHEIFVGEKDSEDWKYANLHYGKAIKGALALTSSDNGNAVEIALVACVIFSCVESLKGHYKSSLEHLISGLRILQEEQQKGEASQTSCMPAHLLPSLFLRMDSQMLDISSAEFGRGRSLANEARPLIPQTFTSAEDALISLETIYNLTLHFLCRVDHVFLDINHADGTVSSIYAERERYRMLHETWEQSFHAMLDNISRKDPKARQPGQPAILALKLTSHALRVMLGVDLLNPATDFDRFIPTFREIVKDSSTYLSMVPTSNPTFSMADGCVGPLYFAAARCRDPEIRHGALALLSECKRREGLWDSAIAAKIAGGIIAIEEASRATVTIRDSTASSDGVAGKGGEGDASAYATPLSEDARVKTVEPFFGPDERGQAAYSMEYPVPVMTSEGLIDCAEYSPLAEW
jgi:hypothetical protein